MWYLLHRLQHEHESETRENCERLRPSGKGELQSKLSRREGNWLKMEDFEHAAEESSWAGAEIYSNF
jgi:hypothetical protein